MSLPPSIVRWLREVPSDRGVALLLRHAERPPLDLSERDASLPITPEGAALAQTLGRVLGDRLRSLRTSPVTRCRETAEALRAGAGAQCDVMPDRMLGDPGVYVADAEVAQRTWITRGHEAVMTRLAGIDAAPLPGLAEPIAAARRLVDHMLACLDEPGIHVFVTHDSLITATVARSLGRALGKNDWPLYLEGAFFWRHPDGVAVAYRDIHPRPGQ